MITFSNLGRMGRLGNQLFQIASTLGIAKNNSLSVGFTNWAYSNYLKKELPNFYGNIKSIFNVNEFCFSNIVVNDNTDIIGYLQSYKFFSNINIQDIFELKDDLKKLYSHFEFKNSVSIHVRRGDYLNNTHVYPILDLYYYESSLKILNEIGINNPKIYIFSDDIMWCKSNFNFENQFFIENNDDIIDLFIMSECENNIISNSTFSWWGAFLNKNPYKKVICPSIWFNNTNEIVNFKYDDLIPENWIKN